VKLSVTVWRLPPLLLLVLRPSPLLPLPPSLVWLAEV
jgi:hypothetical protein